MTKENEYKEQTLIIPNAGKIQISTMTLQALDLTVREDQFYIDLLKEAVESKKLLKVKIVLNIIEEAKGADSITLANLTQAVNLALDIGELDIANFLADTLLTSMFYYRSSMADMVETATDMDNMKHLVTLLHMDRRPITDTGFNFDHIYEHLSYAKLTNNTEVAKVFLRHVINKKLPDETNLFGRFLPFVAWVQDMDLLAEFIKIREDNDDAKITRKGIDLAIVLAAKEGLMELVSALRDCHEDCNKGAEYIKVPDIANFPRKVIDNLTSGVGLSIKLFPESATKVKNAIALYYGTMEKNLFRPIGKRLIRKNQTLVIIMGPKSD